MQNMDSLIARQFQTQAQSVRPLVLMMLAALLVLVGGLRILPEESTPLTVKVMSLLAPTLATASVGAYVGRNLRGWIAAIGLLVVSVIGLFIIRAAGGSVAAIPLLLGWGFINGMMLGPLISAVIAEEGPGIVMQALTGTTAVMMGTGLVAMVTGIDFSFLMPMLFVGLIGLIVVGLIGIFVRFSRTVNLAYSILGMAIFAGYFLFDFFRLSRSENTWEAAAQMTTRLYLDFANFFIYLLQFLMSSRRR
ncbi:MAG: Bax inhibitor-1 family protein [Blastocatellia bacterium]